MTLSKLDKEALDIMLYIALDSSAMAISQTGTIYASTSAHTMSNTLSDYVWNLRGRP